MRTHFDDLTPDEVSGLCAGHAAWLKTTPPPQDDDPDHGYGVWCDLRDRITDGVLARHPDLAPADLEAALWHGSDVVEELLAEAGNPYYRRRVGLRAARPA